MSLIAGRGCRWPPRRDSVSPVRTVVGGGRDTHDGHENSPILVFFSNLLDTSGLSPLTSKDRPPGITRVFPGIGYCFVSASAMAAFSSARCPERIPSIP